MEKEKLEELIERNASGEEAKKLLKDKKLLKEFSQIMEMRKTLSGMHITPPEGLAKNILAKKEQAAKPQRKKLAFVFASLVVVIFVSLFFMRRVLPININSSVQPFNDSVRAPAQKSVPSGEFNLTKSILPEIKLELSENASETEAKQAMDKYCKWEGKDVCVIKEEKVNALINELKRFGEVQTVGIEESNTRAPESGSLEKEIKIKIKIEVIKK